MTQNRLAYWLVILLNVPELWRLKKVLSLEEGAFLFYFNNISWQHLIILLYFMNVTMHIVGIIS